MEPDINQAAQNSLCGFRIMVYIIDCVRIAALWRPTTHQRNLSKYPYMNTTMIINGST